MDATPSRRSHHREPWNKGKLTGQKAPFKPKDIWAMRVRLQQEHRTRELALLNLGIDSKLRACDLVALKVRDITHGEHVANRAIVQQKLRVARRDRARLKSREVGRDSLARHGGRVRTQHSRHVRRRRYGLRPHGYAPRERLACRQCDGQPANGRPGCGKHGQDRP